MNGMRRALLSLAMGGSLLAGGVIGATIAGPVLASAASSSSSASTAASPSTSSGKFVPNEDPAHEAGESAAREAQENAGQFPTVP